MITVANVDEMMDLTAKICLNPRSRDRAMLAAHKADLEACECCGKAIKDPGKAVMVVGPTGSRLGILGPECAKRARAQLEKSS